LTSLLKNNLADVGCFSQKTKRPTRRPKLIFNFAFEFLLRIQQVREKPHDKDRYYTIECQDNY